MYSSDSADEETAEAKRYTLVTKSLNDLYGSEDLDEWIEYKTRD
ncbi:hypothetical protein ACM16X_04230 [Haloarcula japonica]